MSRKLLAYYFGILFSAIYMYQAIFGIFVPELHRGLFILFTLVLVFLIKPFKKVVIVDILFISLSVVSITYFIMRYPEYNIQAGIPINKIDVIIGTITIALSMEACRRYLGWPLLVIALIFLLYLYFGRYFPSSIRHASFKRI